MNFEEYLRMYCMPTRTLDNENYMIVEVNEDDRE